MLAGTRERLVRERIRAMNAIRGYAGEFGLVAPKGPAGIPPLLERLAADPALPELAREMFTVHAAEHARLEGAIAAIDAVLMTAKLAQPYKNAHTVP